MKTNIFPNLFIPINRNQTQMSKICRVSVSVSITLMNVNNSCAEALRSSRCSFAVSMSARVLLPLFIFTVSLSHIWTPLWISRIAERLYTVCFLNHLQISPLSPIKSSNPLGFDCPVQPRTRLEWALLENSASPSSFIFTALEENMQCLCLWMC